MIAGSLALFLAACGDAAKLPEEATIGPYPTLPEPNRTLIPTVNIAPAKGWPEGSKPTPGAGLSVTAYAAGLDHPRWLYVLPNGDVLVAEARARNRASLRTDALDEFQLRKIEPGRQIPTSFLWGRFISSACSANSNESAANTGLS